LGLCFALATVPALAESPASTQTQGYPTCSKTVSPGESEQAHQKYIAAKQDYDEGNYDSAIRRFRDAYALDCTKHELLIIISASYERQGNRKDAVAALEAYVARSPSAPDLATYQAKIENLNKQIALAPAPPAAPPAQVETQGHSALPWVVVGVGGAAAVVGLVLLGGGGWLWAQKNAADAARLAAFVHGLAGEKLAEVASEGWRASDVAEAVPGVVGSAFGTKGRSFP
jgi:tetratricopeptide (TPR) repeat protein